MDYLPHSFGQPAKPLTEVPSSPPSSQRNGSVSSNGSTGDNSVDEGSLSSLLSSLGLDSTFSLGMKFYRSFESKAFTPSYEERNKLVALSLQAKYGSFDADKAATTGGSFTLDLVGRDRKQAWSDLGNMSKDEAKQNFILLLDSLCARFKPFILAHVKEEEARREKEELERIRRVQEEEETRRKEELEKSLAQKKAIQDILNRQTYNQFLSYAQQQYPGEEDRQQYLIHQLQENHYQQYMQQMLQQQPQFSQQQIPVHESQQELQQDHHEHSQDDVFIGSQGHQETASSSHLQDSITSPPNQVNGHPEEDNGHRSEDLNNQLPEEEDGEDDEGDEGEEEDNNVSSEGVTQIVIEPAKMWTRKEVKEFKDSVRSEGGGEGVIKLGHGEIVTINVPTHDEGNCIFWEFATDDYDIGFGVLFEFSENPGSTVSVHVTESEDEDDEEEGHDSSTAINAVRAGVDALTLNGRRDSHGSQSDDPERALTASNGMTDMNPNLEVILPIFRRDSQESVFAGCHPYPGKGVYRLKFDNSYSLWRSKTLYYRVYYTR